MVSSTILLVAYRE